MKMTPAFRETVALAATAAGASVSLHTADPGTSGASEVTGGGYARKTTTWAGGVADGAVAGSQVEFDVPAATITHFGVWSGSTFLWGQSITSATFPFPAKFRVTPTLTVPQGT